MTCTLCTSENTVEVGTLGNQTIHRCRACGSILYKEADHDDATS